MSPGLAFVRLGEIAEQGRHDLLEVSRDTRQTKRAHRELELSKRCDDRRFVLIVWVHFDLLVTSNHVKCTHVLGVYQLVEQRQDVRQRLCAVMRGQIGCPTITTHAHLAVLFSNEQDCTRPRA